MHFGMPMSGALLNTINIRLGARTISVLLRHSGSRLLFVNLRSLPLARSGFELLPANHRPLSYEVDSDLTRFDLTYEKVIGLGNPDFRWIRPTSEWSPMILNYTSGRTSAPKGVVHCHRGIFLVSTDSLIDWCVPHHPVFLWTLPMFHTNGWCFPWGVASVAGTNVCLRRFDGQLSRSLHGTVQILTTGAPPPDAVLARVESLGFAVSHGYGLTETAGVVVSCAWKGYHWDRLPAGERARMKARQGARMVMTTMDVVDEATAWSVPWDGLTMAEVVLRGGHVMLGYLKDRGDGKGN
ncbi:hypothetical protein IEQ34_009116 [Dendrobium chrysotoxum]|uniref:AMP-dependent synthetase/ligase domain-containing protein n=1 Tax=Dendrobium chrysotoxum TaxID=161865 RepID=A0AAV7GZK1_DENCH|nr:hypothetical protein IEQ34_009116 [Dendrobium chrysotoxum]